MRPRAGGGTPEQDDAVAQAALRAVEWGYGTFTSGTARSLHRATWPTNTDLSDAGLVAKCLNGCVRRVLGGPQYRVSGARRQETVKGLSGNLCWCRVVSLDMEVSEAARFEQGCEAGAAVAVVVKLT